MAVVELCQRVCDLHPEVDRDLLLTGALLHDIGKLEELDTGAHIEYSDRGRLMGHTVLTDRWVTREIEGLPDFPEQLADLLRHVLLSHHGQREWGAPIVPMTAEACALHYADVLDARVQQFLEIARQEAAEGKSWSGWHKLLERHIYLGPSGLTTDPPPSPGSGGGELTLEGL
jgi:3'-5' exoribonuclease